MNQVITIKWWHPNPAKDVPEEVKKDLQEHATRHISYEMEKGLIAGELMCWVDHTQYQGSWELYSNDTRNITRKIYDEIAEKELVGIDEECGIVDLGEVQRVLEKYLGDL